MIITMVDPVGQKLPEVISNDFSPFSQFSNYDVTGTLAHPHIALALWGGQPHRLCRIQPNVQVLVSAKMGQLFERKKLELP